MSLSGAGFEGCQKVLWFRPGNSLPSWSVSELGRSEGQSQFDFVCKYELRVLVSVKRKAGIQTPASWNYSSLHDDNVISLRCGLKCSCVLHRDRTGSAVSNGCFGISWLSVEHRLRCPGKQNMRIVGNSSRSWAEFQEQHVGNPTWFTFRALLWISVGGNKAVMKNSILHLCKWRLPLKKADRFKTVV